MITFLSYGIEGIHKGDFVTKLKAMDKDISRQEANDLATRIATGGEKVVTLARLTVQVYGNQKCPLATPGMIDRCFDVLPTTAGPADIKFYFTEAEFSPYGHPLPALQVFNYHSGGWNLQTRGTDSGTCNPGDLGCFVEGTGISAYSPFGLTGAGPNALRLAVLQAQSGLGMWPVALFSLAAVAGAVVWRRRRAG